MVVTIRITYVSKTWLIFTTKLVRVLKRSSGVVDRFSKKEKGISDTHGNSCGGQSFRLGPELLSHVEMLRPLHRLLNDRKRFFGSFLSEGHN